MMERKRLLALIVTAPFLVVANPYVDVVVVPSEKQEAVAEQLAPSKQWEQLENAPRPVDPVVNPAPVIASPQSQPPTPTVGTQSMSHGQSHVLMVATAPKQRVLTNEAEAMRLQRINEDIEIKSRKMPLRTALAMLAGAIDMRTILPPATDTRWDQPVSMRGTYRPAEFLEILEETYGFEAQFKRGVYRFQMREIGKMVTQHYQIRHNNRIRVDIQPTQMSGSNSYGSGGYGSYGNSAMNGMGQSSMMQQTEQRSSYTPEVSLLVEEVERIIGRPINVTKPNSYVEAVIDGAGDVFFVPERNLLVVTASTEHQKLVAKYLAEVDRPQRQVRLDVIFVETSRNPSSELGLDWEGFSGAAIKMDGIEFGPVNWVRPAESQLPLQTFVTMDALQTALHFLAKDEKSSIMSRSDVVVLESEYAEIRGVVEIPIKNAGFAGTGGIGGVLESQVRYQEIGTIVGLVPFIVEGEQGEQGVRVNFSITSSIPAGESQIDGNSFPIIAKREYRYPVVIPNGHALAIGGLAETVATVNNVKVPVLGDIPALGYLFKKQSKSETNRRVIAYIVPRILEPKSEEFQPHEFEPRPTLSATVEDFQKTTKMKGQL